MTALLIIAGALLFSCGLQSAGDTGTLVIRLPGGSSARAAVSDDFTNTLRYRINCTKGSSSGHEFPSGAVAAIPLSPGDWLVSVTVLNAAGESIGTSREKLVTIETGKTAIEHIPVEIDTTRCDIRKFAITSPIYREGIVSSGSVSLPTITVKVPVGTDIFNMGYSMTHTGRSVSFSPNHKKLNFLAVSSYRLSVTPEDSGSTTKQYNLTLEQDLPPDVPTSFAPSGSVWENFGLSAFTEPSGTYVDYFYEAPNGCLYIGLSGVDQPEEMANLKLTIEGMLNNKQTKELTLIEQIAEGGLTIVHRVDRYICDYITTSGLPFRITITSSGDRLHLVIKPQYTMSSAWPSTTKWIANGIPGGLTKPAGATEISVIENSGNPSLLVTFTSVNSSLDFTEIKSALERKLGIQASVIDTDTVHFQNYTTNIRLIKSGYNISIIIGEMGIVP